MNSYFRIVTGCYLQLNAILKC